MAEALLQKLETYVSRHQNTFAHFIEARPIMDLFLLAERRPGERVAKRWWGQDGLDLKEIRTADQEAEWTEGGVGDRRDGDGNLLSW